MTGYHVHPPLPVPPSILPRNKNAPRRRQVILYTVPLV